MIKIYCDGACSYNPGPGAWAYVVFDNERMVSHAFGTEAETTNNRMELTAVIKAAWAFDNCEIILDSKYVKDGITSWIKKWKVNGWKSATGQVKNIDLWQKLDAIVAKKNIIWTWEKGHANNVHDHADILARNAVLK